MLPADRAAATAALPAAGRMLPEPGMQSPNQPPPPGRDIGFIYPAVQAVISQLQRLLISSHLPHRTTVIDAYLLGWLIGLLLLGLATYLGGWVALVAAWAATYRVVELFLVQMKILLTRTWRANQPVVAHERSTLLFMLDYFGLILAGATVFTVIDQRDPSAFTGAPLTFGHALYFAVVTMTTTGYGDILPMTPLARVATCTAILLSVLLITQMLARAFALTRPMTDGQS
jgi:hypothetical protein